MGLSELLPLQMLFQAIRGKSKEPSLADSERELGAMAIKVVGGNLQPRRRFLHGEQLVWRRGGGRSAGHFGPHTKKADCERILKRGQPDHHRQDVFWFQVFNPAGIGKDLRELADPRILIGLRHYRQIVKASVHRTIILPGRSPFELIVVVLTFIGNVARECVGEVGEHVTTVLTV